MTIFIQGCDSSYDLSDADDVSVGNCSDTTVTSVSSARSIASVSSIDSTFSYEVLNKT